MGATSGVVMQKWDPKINALIDATFKKATEAGFKDFYLSNDFHWTLMHGDGHPGNFVWNPKKKQVVMIDMELVGLGNGMMDLCTWMLIRTDPKWRRAHEKEIVELYYETLIESGSKDGADRISKESYTLDQCWKDYALCGFARYCFYITQIPMSFKNHVAQDAYNGLVDFVAQHNITVENVPPFFW